MILTDKKKYQLLLEISHKVRDTLDLDEIMDHLLDTVKKVADYDAAGIFILNQDLVHTRDEQPEVMIAGVSRRGYDIKPDVDDAMLRFGKGIVGHVIFSGESLVVPDVHRDARYVEGRHKTRSEIAVPIVRNNRTIGALNLESDHPNTYDETDLEVLQFYADAAAISIEKAMLHRQLLKKELIDAQLQIARDAQSRLFPLHSPHLKGFDISGICLPTEQIGGDYYDYIKLPHGKLGVAVADVSGNGIASALMMTAFRGLLRMHTHGRSGPVKIAESINRLLPEFSSNNDFVTLLYVVLNSESGEFSYICCGQQPPSLLHADGRSENLFVHGPVLGIIEDVHYSTDTLVIKPGDILTMYTDGVVEITNGEGIEFGIERLEALIHEGRNLAAADLIQRIIQSAHEYSGMPGFADDFTLVIIKRLE